MQFESFLDARGVNYERHSHAETYTSMGLARAEHVSGYMVAKPVIVNTSAGYAMCVLPAAKHLDLRRAASVLNETAVRLATESEMVDLFPDCELGAEPPVGAMFGMRTVMDRGLEEDETLVMQAGTHTKSVKLRRDDWQHVCEPIVAEIASG